MENIEYVKFDVEDIIEALEDLYTKNTGDKIDIRFDKANLELSRSIKSITIKKSISTPAADIAHYSHSAGVEIDWTSHPTTDAAYDSYSITTNASATNKGYLVPKPSSNITQ